MEVDKNHLAKFLALRFRAYLDIYTYNNINSILFSVLIGFNYSQNKLLAQSLPQIRCFTDIFYQILNNFYPIFHLAEMYFYPIFSD